MSTPLHLFKKILVFGGSFDPPHRAHLILPQQVARSIGADLILYIPAGRAPHKLDREQTDPAHRCEMLEIALEEPRREIRTMVYRGEIDRGPDQPSYTVDTLEALQQWMDRRATLRLLIGADQLRIFDTWRNPERIIELAEPVVMVRPPDTRQSLLASLPSDKRDAWEKRLVEVDAIDLSSTHIRERVAAGQSIDELVTRGVRKYIKRHKLYQ